MFSLTSSSNATLKDEQKLASGDCGHVTFVVSVVLSLRHWGEKKKLKAASAGSYKLSFPLGTCGTNGRTESGTNSCLHSGGPWNPPGSKSPWKHLPVRLLPAVDVLGLLHTVVTHCCSCTRTVPQEEVRVRWQIMTVHQDAAVLFV